MIDLKKRDLLGAALIGHHLEKLGVQTRLEPIESWRSCIYAWKPDMVIFNHLLHSHVTELSSKLKEWNVLVGCLLNEGLAFSEDSRRYFSEPQYPDVHCDLFLAWNKPHEEMLRDYKFTSPRENAVAIGIPRFDFYHEPWSAYYEEPRKSDRIRVLLNTTFGLSHFYHRSSEERKSLYRSLGEGKIPVALDYDKMIDDHFRGRERMIDYLRPLLESDKFQISLRPHPREDASYYEDLVGGLSENHRNLIKVEPNKPIFSAILNSDITLNCEDCTTSAESWIAGKPTVTLLFEKNPAFFTEFYKKCSPNLEDPDKLVSLIEREIKEPRQEDFREVRKDYLDRWFFKSDGKSAIRAAEEIHRVIEEKKPKPKLPFSISGYRRGAKVKFFRKFDEPGHTKFKHMFMRKFAGEHANMSIRYRDYLKAIRPSDVTEARKRIAEISD
ncbi:MAG: surface carbohydrate biosynthesis protein [Verrucomicrobiota bacterium]